MPLTRLVNSALDGVAKTLAETAAETAKFAESDLVCYRAASPASLVAAQETAWDPAARFRPDVARRDLRLHPGRPVRRPAGVLARGR